MGSNASSHSPQNSECGSKDFCIVGENAENPYHLPQKLTMKVNEVRAQLLSSRFIFCIKESDGLQPDRPISHTSPKLLFCGIMATKDKNLLISFRVNN
jgi:hypothetical protein